MDCTDDGMGGNPGVGGQQYHRTTMARQRRAPSEGRADSAMWRRLVEEAERDGRLGTRCAAMAHLG